MRLLYLDEAGTDQHAPFLCVAGVLVHGDYEWPAVDSRIVALIDKYIPEADRLDFVFHATDIYHGSKYFDRRKPEWADEGRRTELLNDLAAIIEDLHLPVIFGTYEKNRFSDGPLKIDGDHKQVSRILHDVAVIDCLERADRWLARYAPTELATVTHEDGTPAKPLIKKSVYFARSAAHVKAQAFNEGAGIPGLPLKRIIDSVNFRSCPGEWCRSCG